MNLDVQIDFDKSLCLRRSEAQIQRAIKGTARRFQALADPYVPALTGTMAKSALFSDFGNGEVVYDTPYAHHVYYAPDTINLTRVKHPNAVVRWGDFVAKKYARELGQTAQKILDGGR